MLAANLLDSRCCCACCCEDGDESDTPPADDEADVLLPKEAPSPSSFKGLRFFQDKFESMAFGLFHWFCLLLFVLIALADGFFFETLPFLFTTFERVLDTSLQ